MYKSDLARVRHMYDSAKAIQSFLAGKSREDLNDRLLFSGIIRELEILGEAAASISSKTKEEHSELPWKRMIGMRNRLIHAYFDVDQDVVWKTATESIPAIVEQLENLIIKLHS